jgi:hypothetical protein
MITGDTGAVKLLSLQTDAGVAQSYADKTAFTGASWNLTWRDADGTALASQPTWTITTEGNGVHRVKYTVPAGVWWVEPTVPAGYRIDPYSWGGEGQSYDEDSLAGLFLTAQGVPATNSAVDSDLGDVVQGDSYNSGTLYIPLGKLTKFGYSYANLASGWTISAGVKSAPSDTAITVSGATFGGTVAADGAFSLSWTTFPTGMQLASTEESKTWYLDVQLKRTTSSTIITSNRYSLRVLWERDTTT